MKQHLYAIYTLTRQAKAPDLTIGLAMYREQNPGLLTQEEDRALRTFMGRHGQALSDAFPDRAAFDAAVEAGLAEDEALSQAGQP